jgi:hypothetical protein
VGLLNTPTPLVRSSHPNPSHQRGSRLGRRGVTVSAWLPTCQ